MAGGIRYPAAALLALLLALFATIFARQTHNLYDLPTYIDLTEWPATLLYLAAALAAFRRREKMAALALVMAMMAFLAAQSKWLFDVPLGFTLLIAASLSFLLILPTTWKPR